MKNKLMNTLGQRLKEIRMEKKLSLQDIGNKIGVSRQAISKWEQDPNIKISATNLASLCKFLGVNINWLLHGKGEKNAISDNNSSMEIDKTDVILPLYTEGSMQNLGDMKLEIKIMDKKIPFPARIIYDADVREENAACITANDRSMTPVIPEGTVVGMDISNREIKDGNVYIIDHKGMLKIRVLYREPQGGVRAKPYNTLEYNDESLNQESFRVIGKMFGYYVVVK